MSMFRYGFTNAMSLFALTVLVYWALFGVPSANAQTFNDASSLLTPLNNGFEWGASAADFNNDGLLDIYHPGRLYLNKGAAGFEDILGSTGINEGNSIFGAAFGDYDKDGYLDVIFEEFSGNSRLYRNNHNRRFSYVNSQVNLNVNSLAQGAAWGDYDRNGTLDLYVNNDNGNNQLFRNIGNAFFTDVSDTAGVAYPPDHSYGTAWGDYNNDGYPDIFIASCHPSNPLFSRKHLLRNNGDGTFTDVNLAAGVGDSLASWGIVWLDYDNDGDLDIYIANTQHAPRPGYNRLYQNQGDGTFLRMNDSAGVSGQVDENSFGVAAADFDNDGWVDIYVANSNRRHRLYHNNGDGTFTDIATTAGITENHHSALAVGDFNGDGWLDIFTAGSPQNRLMLNDGGGNHWVNLNLRGIYSNYYGVGARVELYAGGMAQIREIRAGDSFCSQNDLFPAHFGLGSTVLIDSVVVRWSSGQVDRLYNLPVDQTLTILEGTGLHTPPQPFSLLSPVSGEIRALTHIPLRWQSAAPAPNTSITYTVYVIGQNMDTLFTNITDTTFMLPVDFLVNNQSYNWTVDANDGHVILASQDYFSFVYSNLVFGAVAVGDIVNDGSFSEGAAWADYDDDGDMDVLVANILDQDNLLYRNNGNGSFSLLSTLPPAADGGFSYGSHFVDFDNDNDLDIYVINRNQANFLYENDNGSWIRITSGVIVTDVQASWSGAWVDADNDGDLDLFVANFNQPNALYWNNGDGTFTRETLGEIVTDVKHSVGCAWSDYDGDGFLDLFVANADFAAGENNSLYRNNGDGTFSKITGSPVVNDGGNSIGGSWGDYDNDGDPDLFVTNYSGENNFLYQNTGDGTFTRVTAGVVVNDGGMSVGSGWGDFDNDGDLDLYVSDDGGNNRLYENIGNGGFLKGVNANLVGDSARSNAVSWVDVDNDGALDVFVANGDQPPDNQNNALYLNFVGSQNHWLQVRLIGTASNRFGVGARIRVLTSIGNIPHWQMRDVLPQKGYNSQQDYLIQFGLASASQVDSVVIEWPSGTVQSFANLSADQRVVISEDGGVVGIAENEAPLPKQFRLEQNYPNPFNPVTNIGFRIPQGGRADFPNGAGGFVELKIFDVLGREIKTLVKKPLTPGNYVFQWNGRDDAGNPVASGVYLYRLKIGKRFVQSRKMVLLR